jgi:ATP-binding cassette subfamily B protein
MQKEPRPLNPVPLRELHQLTFDHVGFSAPDGVVTALTDISFTVTRGDTIAFVGPSGAGKTTLVKLLVGLYRPQSGDIRYNGHSASDVDLNELREQIGFVTQDTQLFSGTIRENLLFVRPNATDAGMSGRAAQGIVRQLVGPGLEGAGYRHRSKGAVKVSGGEKAASVDCPCASAATPPAGVRRSEPHRWTR